MDTPEDRGLLPPDITPDTIIRIHYPSGQSRTVRDYVEYTKNLPDDKVKIWISYHVPILVYRSALRALCAPTKDPAMTDTTPPALYSGLCSYQKRGEDTWHWCFRDPDLSPRDNALAVAEKDPDIVRVRAWRKNTGYEWDVVRTPVVQCHTATSSTRHTPCATHAAGWVVLDGTERHRLSSTSTCFKMSDAVDQIRAAYASGDLKGKTSILVYSTTHSTIHRAVLVFQEAGTKVALTNVRNVWK